MVWPAPVNDVPFRPSHFPPVQTSALLLQPAEEAFKNQQRQGGGKVSNPLLSPVRLADLSRRSKRRRKLSEGGSLVTHLHSPVKRAEIPAGQIIRRL